MGAELLSYERAAAIVAEHARKIAQFIPPHVQSVDLAFAAGRIFATPLRADDDQPPFPRSTRDGYACCAAEASAHIALPIAGATRAGEAPPDPLPPNAAWEIMTGAPVPAGADCVIMLEHVLKSENSITLSPSRTIAVGENIVARGAQARRDDELLTAGVSLGPAQLALAASCGYENLDVFIRPRVAILTTGDELVPIHTKPGPGRIRNSNAPMLALLVARAGGDPIVLPTAADTAEALDAALAQALHADMLLISGGVSAGTYDLVEPALARLGAQFHFTGVRIQPGKPLVFGKLKGNGFSRYADSSQEGALQAAGEPYPQGTKRQGTTSVAPNEDQNNNGALAPVKATGFSPYIDSPQKEGASAPEEKSIPFFGLPGNPISSAVTFLLFAAPILAALAGSRETHPRFVLAQLARDTDRKGKPGLTRFLPALCAFDRSVHKLPQVATVPWHGSGDLPAFAQSNCFLVIPEEASHLEAGSIVRILLH